MNIVEKALAFATKAHQGQVRKYTYEPYIVHPIEVMNIVKTVEHTDEMLCAALLHDVCEDCGVEFQEIQQEFGSLVCEYVKDLTDISTPEDGNRSRRKEIDRNHYLTASKASKTIKLADLISNSSSICKYDKEFAKVYIKEKELILELLKDGSKELWDRANIIVQVAKKELGIK